jgi:alpha-tubulin suppressor-like RCC1 family protein
MPNFSAKWGLMEQLQAVAAGTWTGLPTFALYAWGANDYGQLGIYGAQPRSSPVQVGSLTDWYWAKISATAYSVRSALALKTDNTLWAWGENANGQVGDGTIISRSSPVQIGLLSDWSSVSAGRTSGAIKTNGTLWAWGFGTFGSIGDGASVSRSSPVQIGALTNWASVATAASSTASIKTDGTLWTWGANDYGQLGRNNVASVGSPVQIGALTNWSSISVTSNAMVSVKTNGTLWTWGRNTDGRLGQNIATTVNRSSPVQVGALTNWSSASFGNAHVAAVKTDGTLWAWGSNLNGRLGDGTVANRSSPVQIGALTNWLRVSAGGSATSAIKTDGTLWTWGDNLNAQLGQNIAITISRSSPVQVGAGTNWSATSAGFNSTFAILQGVTN